ncbi:Phospholipid/glycerol acyltransferase [Beggiatoa sp. PS]|nr:Phospholipid/glycerol acyltransferase [Beggiatoa sp. PS]
MLFLRSLLFYIGIILALLIFVPIALLLSPLPYQQRYRVIVNWGYFTIWWLKKTCRLTYQVEGLENIPNTPTIILSKHQSAWETIVYQQIFPAHVWLLKRELLYIPLLGWALASLNPISIDRKNLRQSISKIVEQGKQRLANGLWLLIFPEGTRVAPGEKKRYGIGGALLGEKTGCPILPVAHNSGQFWPSSSFIKYPGTIQIVIGSMIDTRDKTYKEINSLVENWIEETVQDIETRERNKMISGKKSSISNHPK